MAVRYHPRCPYCKVYLENSDRPAYYDSPLGICHNCKKTFLDPQSKELALKPHRKRSIFEYFCEGIFTGLWFAFLLACVAFFISGEKTPAIHTFGIGAPILCILGILWELKKRNKTEQRRLDAWEKSAQRLQDTNYAALLANHGYSVPPQYLPPEYKYDPNAAIYKRIKVSLFSNPSAKP